ncbi:probable G-protein coupled receptor 160, partial [Kryptolebias marmoratus]
CLQDTCLGNRSVLCKLLKNAILTVLVWMAAFAYSFGFFHSELAQLDTMSGTKAMVCKVEKSTAVTVIILGLFSVTFLSMLPFCSGISQWVKEADQIYETLEEKQKMTSDLPFTSTWSPNFETTSKEEKPLEKKVCLRPPLWFSLMLGFLIFWMPYLVVTVSCLLCGFAVPAHISVNLLWLECTNSFLAGLTFWVKSKIRGPYVHLPDNVCSWQIYWHLSKGTIQPDVPIAVLNPTKTNRNALLFV